VKVILICACTVCGRISPAGLSGPEDRRRLEKMRDRTAASLIGAGTLRDSDPELRGSGGVLARDRIRAVISASGTIPIHNKKLFQDGPPPLLFTGAKQAAILRDQIGTRAQVVGLPAGPGGLSLIAAINTLQNMGADSVLIEGGGKLNYALLKERIVDEILLTITPKLSGDCQAASVADGPVSLGDPFLELEMVDCQCMDSGELFVTYRLRSE
jgi:riboflavin biosynthesis pyrimidine reductase